MFCSDPLPTTGRTRRVAPSSMRLARSSAILTEMPAARPVWSWTTPLLTIATSGGAAAIANGAKAIGSATAAMTAAAIIGRIIVVTRGYFVCETLGLTIGLGRAEVKRVAVPGKCFGRVAARMQADTAEKRRIEGRAHPHRRLPVAGIGSALVKKPCRSDITRMKEDVAAGQELRDLPGGEARCHRGRRHSSRRRPDAASRPPVRLARKQVAKAQGPTTRATRHRLTDPVQDLRSHHSIGDGGDAGGTRGATGKAAVAAERGISG